jgi:lipopolysaccharide biosynthesis glycosyltransferase
MQRKLAFVSTLNRDYLLGFKVFLYSILQHNPNLDYDYIIFNEGDITQEDVAELRKIYSKIILKEIDTTFYSDCKFQAYRAWKINPAHRLEIFKLTEYDKIIFFDADMLCTGSIAELFTMSHDFAGVAHPMHDAGDIYNYGYFKQNKGFNGGLMVVDKKFLTEKTVDDLKKIISGYTWFGNQASLNIYFKDTVTYIANKYFLSTPFMNFKNIKESVIWHFVGDKKPWHGVPFDGKNIDVMHIKYNKHVLGSTAFHVLMKVQSVYEKYLAKVL